MINISNPKAHIVPNDRRVNKAGPTGRHIVQCRMHVCPLKACHGKLGLYHMMLESKKKFPTLKGHKGNVS